MPLTAAQQVARDGVAVQRDGHEFNFDAVQHGLAGVGAGSGSFALEAGSGVHGELQVGSFMFMDVDYARSAAAV